MSYTVENWRKAITKLLELTSKNEIKWSPSELYEDDGINTVDAALMAKYRDKAYVVSKARYKHYLDEEEYAWADRYNLAIFESAHSEYELIATAPDISSVSTLFDAAKEI